MTTSESYMDGVSIVDASLVVMKAEIINPNNKPPKIANRPLDNAKITYQKFLYSFFCIKTIKEIIKEYTTATIAPIPMPASKPSLNVIVSDDMLDNPPAIPLRIKPTRKYAK